VRGPSGHHIAAPLNDFVGRSIFFMGDLDRKLTFLCRKFVRPGDVVLDIGANLGLLSFLLSSLVGHEGKVHAFEPNPSMLALMREAIERNKVTNICLHPVALGDANGSMSLSIPSGNAGAASLVRAKQGGRIVEVPVCRLDEVLKRQGMVRVRLIKIDVEGFEANVLNGATELFCSNPPDHILFELNEFKEDKLIQHPAVSFLHSHGYEIFSIPRSLWRVRVEPADLQAPANAHDYLAVHSCARN
jgi:FkbM family methyltransferase